MFINSCFMMLLDIIVQQSFISRCLSVPNTTISIRNVMFITSFCFFRHSHANTWSASHCLLGVGSWFISPGQSSAKLYNRARKTLQTKKRNTWRQKGLVTFKKQLAEARQWLCYTTEAQAFDMLR